MIVYEEKHCLQSYCITKLIGILFFYSTVCMAELSWVFSCQIFVQLSKISKFFSSNIGIKQGCNMSAILFNLFINKSSVFLMKPNDNQHRLKV